MNMFQPIFDVRDLRGGISALAITSEPIFDIAHLAHVELLTPDLEGTLCFFKNLLGLEQTERSGRSAYLRGYEEHYHHSLKITAAPSAGLGHIAWRVRTPQALERRVRAIEATGLGRGWSQGDLGHGRAYQFETPEGHRMELFWEVDYITPPADKETLLRNRPQKRPARGSQFVGSTTSTCSPPTEKAFATSWWISSDFGNVNGSSRRTDRFWRAF